jgi:hypothetical protein
MSPLFLWFLFFNDGSWLPEEIDKFARGEIVDRGGKRYRVCGGCHKPICVNKRLLGSLHFCEPEKK